MATKRRRPASKVTISGVADPKVGSARPAPGSPGWHHFNHAKLRGHVYPLNGSGKLPIAKGFGVNLPRIDPGDGNDWNVRLVNPFGETIELYIEEMTTSFQLNGSTAQSQKYRQFYPRSFAQPTITLSGRAPNQFQYNRLAAFVRYSHWAALSLLEGKIDTATVRHFTDSNGNTAPNPTLHLQVRAGGPKIKHAAGQVRGSSKGQHRAWALDGYIKSIQAGSTRFENAPAFSFDFVAAASIYKGERGNVGIYQDEYVAGSQLLDWMQVFKSEYHFKRTKAGFRSTVIDDALLTFSAGVDLLANDPDEVARIIRDLGSVLDTVF